MHNIKRYIIRNVIINRYHKQEDVKQIRHNLGREITTSSIQSVSIDQDHHDACRYITIKKPIEKSDN